jgi:hypothetical protein
MTPKAGADEARRQRRGPKKPPRRAREGEIQFPEDDYATFEAYVRKRVAGSEWILAIDPGTASCGWALMDPFGGDEIISGSGPDFVVARELTRDGHSAALLWVIEAPYAGRSPEAAIDENGQPFVKGSRASPDSVWKLGRAMGVVEGALDVDRWMRDMQAPCIWKPRPPTWRSILGLNPESKGKAAREEAAERCWRYARSVTGRHLEGPMGGRKIDEAMAICMVVAARKIAAAVAGQPAGAAA